MDIYSQVAHLLSCDVDKDNNIQGQSIKATSYELTHKLEDTTRSHSETCSQAEARGWQWSEAMIHQTQVKW